MNTTNVTAKPMWALVDGDTITGVYNSRAQARSYRGILGGTVRRAMVSLI